MHVVQHLWRYPKQPEDSADGFNGLLLSVFITAQICHVNTNFFEFRRHRDPRRHHQNMYFVCFKKSKKRPAVCDFKKVITYFTGNKPKWEHTHKHKDTHTIPHTASGTQRCMVSTSLPCLDEYRKCQPCTAQAEDTCLGQRSSLSPFSTVFLKSGVSDEVPPPPKGPSHFRAGWGNERKEGRRCQWWVFTIFFSPFWGFFFPTSILLTEEGPCLDPYIAWRGHKVVGGRDFRLKMGNPPSLGRVHDKLWRLWLFMAIGKFHKIP